MVVKARINGGPVLRLLLDSGAQYLVLDRKAAAKSACRGTTDLDLVGVGAATPDAVKRGRAETVQVDDLTVRDVPLLVEDRNLADGIQGVLPLSIFANFLIHLDVPGKNLDLLPYSAEEAEPAGALQAIASNRVLFVRGTVNERSEGYFLLDTGAAYSAISQKLARQLNLPQLLADRVALRGGTMDMDAPLFRGAIRVRFGSRELATDPVVAVDLDTASRFHHLEVSGLIGYPALCDSVLTVSYRDHFVSIDPR